MASDTPWDASCALCFAHLADRGAPVRLVQYPHGDVARSLAGANAIVVVRSLFEFPELIRAAQVLGIPLYYFLDDNFILLREEPEAGRFYEQYSLNCVREALRGFAGVLLSSQSLMEYFDDHQLHGRLTFFPPICGPSQAARPYQRRDPLSIAFFGGPHRLDAFLHYVYPAIRRLSYDREVVLVVPGLEAAPEYEDGRLQVVHVEYDPVYTAALQQFAVLGADILVHPSRATRNNAYKTCNVLINARALGAVPIASNSPPYDAVANEGVVILCENTEQSWYEAITRVATDVDLQERVRLRLIAYCDEQFGGESNVNVVNTILETHPVPAVPVRVARLVAGAIYLSAGRLRRFVRRLRPAG